MFAVIFICILGEGIFANRWKNRKKFRATRFSGSFYKMFCLLPFLTYNLLLYFMPALLASTRVASEQALCLGKK